MAEVALVNAIRESKKRIPNYPKGAKDIEANNSWLGPHPYHTMD